MNPRTQRSPLFRDPADWARDWGWLSPKKAENRAREVRDVADAIERTLGDDEAAAIWCPALRKIADQIDPANNAAEYRRRKATRQESRDADHD